MTPNLYVTYCPRDLREDSRGLDRAEKLSFRLLIERMMETGAGIPDDKGAGVIAEAGKLWPGIRQTLLSRGLLSVADGLLINAKAVGAGREAFRRRGTAATKARAKWEARGEANPPQVLLPGETSKSGENSDKPLKNPDVGHAAASAAAYAKPELGIDRTEPSVPAPGPAPVEGEDAGAGEDDDLWDAAAAAIAECRAAASAPAPTPPPPARQEPVEPAEPVAAAPQPPAPPPAAQEPPRRRAARPPALPPEAVEVPAERVVIPLVRGMEALAANRLQTNFGLPRERSWQMLAKWKRQASMETILSVLADAERQQPEAIIPWVTAAIKARGNREVGRSAGRLTDGGRVRGMGGDV